MFYPALIVKNYFVKGRLNEYSPFLTQDLFSPFFTQENFKQPANAERPKSTHPTVQCTQDISEVNTDTI